MPFGLGTGFGIGVELPLSELELELNCKNGIDPSSGLISLNIQLYFKRAFVALFVLPSSFTVGLAWSDLSLSKAAEM